MFTLPRSGPFSQILSCERICEKGPFGVHFRFWVRHMAWKYIWLAFICTLLRCASMFRYRDTLAQSVKWLKVCFRENGQKTFTSGKTATFRILSCYEWYHCNMADSAQNNRYYTTVTKYRISMAEHTVSFSRLLDCTRNLTELLRILLDGLPEPAYGSELRC